jgi:hypothetical protein
MHTCLLRATGSTFPLLTAHCSLLTAHSTLFRETVFNSLYGNELLAIMLQLPDANPAAELY